MALKLDNNLINELGLGALPEEEKKLLLRQIYEKLEMNVGVRLADQMSNEQLDEFEKFVDANDDKGAFQWLEGNFPNYKDVVNEEFEKLKNEIRQYAPQMLAVAQHNATQAAGAAAQQAQPQDPDAAGQQFQQQPGQYQQQQPFGAGQAPGNYGQPQQPGQMGYGQPQYGPQGQPGQYPPQQSDQPQYGQQPPQNPYQGQQYPPQQPPAGPQQQ